MIKRTVEVTDLHVRSDKCEDCVDVYIASEAYARISELASRCQDLEKALHDATHCDCGKKLSRGLCYICDNDD